jgi:glycogen debranching enzyme
MNDTPSARQPSPAAAQGAEECFAVEVTTATALALYRPRTLKHGNTFLVLDHHGDAQALGTAAEGLFHEDTRHLSRLALRLGRERPLLLSSGVSEDNALLTVDLTNPDLPEERDRSAVSRDTVHIRRCLVLGTGVLHEQLHIRNYGVETVEVELSLEHSADFADIFEVRGMRRPARGVLAPPATEDAAAVFSYRGRDGVPRTTRIEYDPAPAFRRGGEVCYALRLGPGEQRTLAVSVRCLRLADRPEAGRAAQAASGDPGFEGWLALHRNWTAARSQEVARIHTSNEAFNDWMNRSRADLDMLCTDAPGGPFPYAGIPWFSTAFGRDSLITALLCLWLDPALAEGVLRYLAARQATESDPARDAEPGKILHETRGGEMAATGEVPFGLYYGSVDATPLFVMLAAAQLERTGDIALARALWPHVATALDWIERQGDRDGDGFLEYFRHTPEGLANQGWKDSWDSVFHADGRLAEGPIALVEVQAYAYAAWRGAARMARTLGHAPRAEALEARAERLRRVFDTAFWCEDLGTYALALDGEKRPCRVRSSNAGHALLTGIAPPERAARVAATLLEPSSFCGWGVRTLAEGEARYNPMSYHNGSVWPHDNALIGLGLTRYGLREPLVRLLGGLFDAALWTDMKRLPELFCGFPRLAGQGPTAYPVACLPQAWASASAFAVLGALLGVTFRPGQRQIRFIRPVLPPWLEVVRIENLRLGSTAADLELRRHDGGEVSLTVLGRHGAVEVAVIS